jgi:hypothetical protein
MTQPALFTESAGRHVAPAAAPTRADLHVQLVTIALPGGRCLRVARVDAALVLVDGFAEERPLRALARGVSLPVELWPAVRDIVDALAGAP